jgi:alpha-tubulin suppressor-like RCC1 family protein
MRSSPHPLLALLAAAALATPACSTTLVDEDGANLVPATCSCAAPAGGSPVCNPGGACDYVCQGDLLKCGGGCLACVPPANASPACVQGSCGFSCNTPARLCPAAAGGAASCQVEGDLSCGTTCEPCAGPAIGPGRGVCQPGPALGAGSCAIACDAGNHACGGSCYSDADAARCGPSCLVCAAPANASPLCEGGACAFACNPGWMRCGDGCCRGAAVAAGGEFGCVLLDDGRVRCWGANDRGQLGDGSTTFRPVPVDVTGLPAAPARVVAIATGWAHACGVVSPGGQVWCWGDNTTGELGAGFAAPFSTAPVLVPGVAGVAAPASASAPLPVAAGGGVAGSPPAPFGHTCAIGSGGLVCWGANGSGQLGDGSTSQSSSPRPVSGIATASALAAGERHTCAVGPGGAVCWGANGSGQLGDGSTAQSSLPRTVSGLPAATFLAAGRAFSCAVAGSPPLLFCWGDNGEGQVTTSPPPPAIQPTPLTPSLGGGFSPGFVAAGRAHACGLEPGSATIKCFGANGQSQLTGAPTATGKVDVTLTGLVGTANAVAAGGNHTCALLTDGSVQCWGANDRGQTGTGQAGATVVTPTFVSGR